MLWTVDHYYLNQVFLSVGSLIAQVDVVKLPKIYLTSPTGFCTAAENNGTFIVLTFGANVGAGAQLQVPVQDGGIRNSFGGYLCGGAAEVAPAALIQGYALMTASGPILAASVEAHTSGSVIDLTLPVPSQINETRVVASWQNSTDEVNVKTSGGALIAPIAIGEAYSFVWNGTVWQYYILNGF
jgi:hypothetical protein